MMVFIDIFNNMVVLAPEKLSWKQFMAGFNLMDGILHRSKIKISKKK